MENTLSTALTNVLGATCTLSYVFCCRNIEHGQRKSIVRFILRHPVVSLNSTQQRYNQYKMWRKRLWCTRKTTLFDWLSKVLCPTGYKIGHFGDVLYNQSRGQVMKKVNETNLENTKPEWSKLTQEHTKIQIKHTHTPPFNGPFSGTTQVGRYQKGKTNLDLLKQETVSGSGIRWAICKSAPRSRQITMPAPHYSVFLQAGCPSCRPTNSVKALKAKALKAKKYKLNLYKNTKLI